METIKAGGEMSRRSFFKLGLASISAAVLLFVSGCGGEEDEEDGGDDEEDDEGGGGPYGYVRPRSLSLTRSSSSLR